MSQNRGPEITFGDVSFVEFVDSQFYEDRKFAHVMQPWKTVYHAGRDVMFSGIDTPYETSRHGLTTRAIDDTEENFIAELTKLGGGHIRRIRTLILVRRVENARTGEVSWESDLLNDRQVGMMNSQGMTEKRRKELITTWRDNYLTIDNEENIILFQSEQQYGRNEFIVDRKIFADVDFRARDLEFIDQQRKIAALTSQEAEKPIETVLVDEASTADASDVMAQGIIR
ncbi:hypothetical protein LCGC14_1748280 [marine sediment metagenome]|uniref:Uncharacterized protein n=1 Tax=marine sediment metagenome TaxID=412755 RepID=A0A0F9H4P6_9ZZZZ